MANLYEEITDQLRAWIGRQAMFFVGTAPLAAVFAAWSSWLFRTGHRLKP